MDSATLFLLSSYVLSMLRQACYKNVCRCACTSEAPCVAGDAGNLLLEYANNDPDELCHLNRCCH